MSDIEEVGILGTGHEEREIEWRIADFLSVTKYKDYLNSPDFHFADVTWHLQLSPQKLSKPRSVSLYLMKDDGILENSVEYNLGVKKCDSSFEQLSRGIFKINSEWIGPFFVKFPEVQQQNSTQPSSDHIYTSYVCASDMLLITCKLKRETLLPSLSKMLDRPETMELIKLETLSQNFKNVFANKESCDTTLYVMDKEYKAHRTVLMARSSVFAAMFLHETSEKQTGIITIPDCDPNSFEQFLEFLYSGKLKNQSARSALHLYVTSEKYDVQELKTFCAEFLVKNLTEENFCDVVTVAEKYDDATLMSEVQHFFNKNLSKVLVTADWDRLLLNNRRLANKLLIEMSKVKAAN